MSGNKSRSLRAILRSALTWGAAWAIAGGALIGGIALFSQDPSIESLPERIGVALMTGAMWGVRFGIAGAVIGTAFSTVIRLGYRGKRLADISPGRFAILGAVVGGVGVPLYLQMMNVMSGGPIPWNLVMDDGVWAAVFGAAAAGGSILMARRADARSLDSDPDPAQLEEADPLDALPIAEQRESSLVERSRSIED